MSTQGYHATQVEPIFPKVTVRSRVPSLPWRRGRRESANETPGFMDDRNLVEDFRRAAAYVCLQCFVWPSFRAITYSLTTVALCRGFNLR
jgi:hypothetical protein